MKLSDIIFLTEAGPRAVVLQSGQDFRVDPNPDHTEDRYPDTWTQDIAQAHVFSQKHARRFLLAREESARNKRMAHKQLKMIPVELDEQGHAGLPKAKREPSMFKRMLRRTAA